MSTSSGRAAEDLAASYLVENGYKVIAKNWRDPSCEIDIIAKRDHTLYFVEVKYRSSARQGTGLDYITSKKLSQMSYAAQVYLLKTGYSDAYELSAIEVCGQADAMKVSVFLTGLT